jgi:Raf kinase inhibitor-like YbhB/YbcL family protein
MTKMIKGLGWLISLGFIVLLAGCKGNDALPASEGGLDMTIQITSTAFSEGGKIPRIYTCDDQNVSPPLTWTGVPTTTVSLALIMDDPDAPSGTWVHWVLYNLAPDTTNLDQGKTGLGTEGKNDFNRLGYGGPCPPRGSTHRYYIKLFALDTRLDLKSGATKAQVESAMRGHILAQGQLMGRYGR